MDLTSAASYFDDTACYNAVTGGYVCDGQFDLFDDSKRDSMAADRRILSVASSITLPSLLSIHNDVFIVGEGHKDYALGDVTRVKYVLHKAVDVSLATAPQMLSVGTPTLTYAGIVWVKNTKRETESSRLHADYQVVLPSSTQDYTGNYVVHGARTLFVQGVAEASGGFDILECSDLGVAPVRTLSYTSQSQNYDAVTDEFITSLPVVRQGVVSRYFADYEIVNGATPKAAASDTTIKVLQASGFTPKEGDLITDTGNGRRYRVSAVQLGTAYHTLQASYLWA
jgi:hypothetical protein